MKECETRAIRPRPFEVAKIATKRTTHENDQEAVVLLLGVLVML